MSKIPSFVTGANAKIKAGGITIAYAQDVTYNTTITTIPIETMGRYEVVSNEPVAYFIDGSLSIIRYTKVAQQNAMAGAAEGGNGLGKWVLTDESGEIAANAVNPSQILASQTWNLEIFQKTADPENPEKVVKVKDVRLTRKGGGINKRGVLVEQFAFNAILAEDDSFDVSNSGDADLS